jgi:hypothetical protein
VPFYECLHIGVEAFYLSSREYNCYEMKYFHLFDINVFSPLMESETVAEE